VFLINVRKLSVEEGSILYSCRDITEKAEAEEKLRQSEQRYRLLAENSLLGVYIHQDDRFVYSNRRLQEILGYSAEELGAIKVWEIFPEEIQPEMRSLTRAQYEGREQPTSFERQACTRTGETRWLEISAVATKYEAKPAVLGTMADISERTHARQELENALQEREVLLREIHHRVKNNLAIISSLLSFQTRSPEEMPLSRAFEEVASRIRSMALAHEILMQSENLAVLNVHDYLGKLVAETASSSGSALSIHMIETSTDNAFLDIDTAVPLGFIITEIIMSMGKHAASSSDERRARIEFHRIQPDRCRLSVSDTGGGIPKDAQIENPVSLSAQLLRIYVEQLRGVIEPEKYDGRYIAITLPYRQENPKAQ
jgi:PAS domain S-box-containing protein